MPAIGGPARILVLALAVSQLDVLARTDIHDKNIEVALRNSAGPGESEMLSILIPRGIGRFALAVGDAFHPDAVGVHLVNLLMSGSAREEQQARVLGIHLRF